MKRKTEADLHEEIEQLQSRVAEFDRAKEQLRRLATVVLDSNDAVTIQDFDGNITAWNRGAERMYGWSEEEALAMNIQDTVPEEQREQALAFVEAIRSGELVESLETKRFTKHGRVLDVWLVVTKLLDNAGTPVSIATTERDITDRKRAEEDLQESEHQKALVLDNTSEMIAYHGVDHRLKWANNAYLKAVGVSLGEVKGKKCYEAWGLDRLCHECPVMKAMETGKPCEGELTPENQEHWRSDQGSWLVRAAPVRDSVGAIIGGIEVAHDVTERKLAEKAAHESEARFRTLFDGVRDGILMADVQTGRFAAANKAICRMLGYSHEEMLGLGIKDIHPAEDLPQIKDVFDKQVRGEISIAPDLAVVRKDGTVFYADVNSATVTVDDETYLLGVFRDITERKQAEAKLKNTEEQLRQSQKLEAIGQLAGGVAHDFNNMLAAIIGYSDLLLMNLKEGDPMRADVTSIRQCADRSAGLTRQLLAFSRKQSFQPKVLDLNEVAANLEKMLRRLIGEDIDLVLKQGADLGRAKADPGQIEQVIMNLAVNARDAMPNGGRLTIETANVELDEEYARTHVSAQPGPHVMLAVADIGCGMDKETLSHMFEPFFTTKEQGKGTGLGLPTVYGIVKQSGGNIWVYSEPGKGTTFKVYLPRVEAVPEKIVREKAIAPKRGTETVLVVEDEDTVRELVARILTMQGYKVLEAQNGGEALLLCEKHSPGLLITDVVMPNMGGRELVERVEKIRPGLKVLYTSGYTDDAIVRQGVLDAGVPFIQKPYTVSLLLAKVREVLEAPDR